MSAHRILGLSAGSKGSARALLGRLAAIRATRWSGLALLLLLGAALFADCLASDLPILLRLRGELYVLPNMTRPGALRPFDNQTLAGQLGPGDFAIWPLVRYGPSQTQPGGRLDVNQPPSSAHWLGTDDVGRDVFAGVVHGARVAFLVGLFSVLLSVLIGLLLGALAGSMLGLMDGMVTWGVAVMTSFPAFVLVLVVQGLVRAQDLWGIVLLLGLTGWAGVARLVRGEVLRARSLVHVEAARALGASRARVLLVHVIPYARGPVLVAATFGMASAILVESGLSFLGLGPDTASWGRILAIGLTNREAWWLVLFPGMAISATVLAYNFFAEGLQEALDPRREVLPRSRRKGAAQAAPGRAR
ncbi:MAG: ABC transporter permease [Polyangia bacterium]|jgi:peptide/nickel transport system permease protein|nr:ABC transporter permease [Polyangia bacterium]